VGSCTSAAEDAPADVRGTVHALRTGVVATTPRTLTPGRHHVAAVRQGGTVALHVDGTIAVTARGSVSGSITNDIALTVGADSSGAFRGGIEQPAVHGSALTAREIAALADRALRAGAGVAHHEEVVG